MTKKKRDGKTAVAAKGKAGKAKASKAKLGKSAKGKSAKAKTEVPELDGRSAARALKKALAEQPLDESKDAPRPKAPRRRRPPTSHGPVPPRPEVRALPVKKEAPKPGAVRPGFFRRHDVGVVLIALAMLAGGAVLSRTLSETSPRRFDRIGLSFNRPAVFLPPSTVEPPDTSIDPAADGTELPYHVVYQSPADPQVRLEVLVDHRPSFNNLRAARALDRASQYGEMVWVRDSRDIKIDGRPWLRVEYRYAYKASDFDSPKVATAIESATLNGALLYVVTFHGDQAAASELADTVIPSLKVDPNHPAAAVVKE